MAGRRHLSSHTFSHFCFSRFSFISVALAGHGCCGPSPLMDDISGVFLVYIFGWLARQSTFSLFISLISPLGLDLRVPHLFCVEEVETVPLLRPNDYGHQLCKWMSLIKKANVQHTSICCYNNYNTLFLYKNAATTALQQLNYSRVVKNINGGSRAVVQVKMVV